MTTCHIFQQLQVIFKFKDYNLAEKLFILLNYYYYVSFIIY